MKSIAIAAFLAVLALPGVANAATEVQANGTAPTSLGTFAPGTYTFSTTGIISLTGGSDFLVNADGTPQGTISTPGYDYFNPNGSYTADGNCGPAGCGIKIGALAGTFDPAGAAGSFFLLGTNSTLNFASPTTLFGLVNDTFATNNSGSFSVSATAVPEPASWAMMLFGFGAVGFGMRRRRGKEKLRVRYAI